jgi:hypothetical protein
MAQNRRRADPPVSTTTSDWKARLPDGSKSVQSVWVWRGFFLMSLVALGLAISFTSSHEGFYSVAWYVIAAGWFAISMWLWRRHVRDDNETWALQQKSGPKSGNSAASKTSNTRNSTAKSRGRTR